MTPSPAVRSSPFPPTNSGRREQGSLAGKEWPALKSTCLPRIRYSRVESLASPCLVLGQGFILPNSWVIAQTCSILHLRLQTSPSNHQQPAGIGSLSGFPANLEGCAAPASQSRHFKHPRSRTTRTPPKLSVRQLPKSAESAQKVVIAIANRSICQGHHPTSMRS